ncbi:MAG: uroporphyrinogen decarboxylase family protein [Phycisphaerae bacterium]
MTKRERFLKALRNEKVDELVWAPNFDYWLTVNRAEGTVPEQFKEMSRNSIVRAIGGYIWNRVSGFKQVLDSSVREIRTDVKGDQVHEYHTPLGSVREVYQQTEGEHRSQFLAEHFIKNLEDLRVLTYVVNATHYEPDYEPTVKALAETGDDGVVLTQTFCVPFIQFCKTDAGYMNGFYLWADHRKDVDTLIKAYFESFLQGYRVLADGPVDIISTGDNMDGTTISPDIFKEYAIPFYREAKKITSAKGKIFEGHWCGRTQNLLSLVPGCGLDVVEAIVSKPMADIELSEAIDRLKGQVVLQGGLPAVLVCREGGSYEKFEQYMKEVILPLKGRRGFILGMADNVPPNADFSRVEAVTGIINR